jgi:hypothetical protein
MGTTPWTVRGLSWISGRSRVSRPSRSRPGTRGMHLQARPSNYRASRASTSTASSPLRYAPRLAYRPLLSLTRILAGAPLRRLPRPRVPPLLLPPYTRPLHHRASRRGGSLPEWAGAPVDGYNTSRRRRPRTQSVRAWLVQRAGHSEHERYIGVPDHFVPPGLAGSLD